MLNLFRPSGGGLSPLFAGAKNISLCPMTGQNTLKKKLPDLYKILGVDPKAEAEQIKDAYRELALKLHPDRSDNTEDHELFKQVGDAYQILSDLKRRKQYDAMRLMGLSLPVDRLRDFMSDRGRIDKVLNKVGAAFAVVTGLVRRSKSKPGRDLRVETIITFGQSFRGLRRSFTYGREGDCVVCEGIGWSEVSACGTCGGTGRMTTDLLPGIGKRCPKCNAAGWIGDTKCDACQNTGRVLRRKETAVDIPPGIHDDGRVRVKGLGEGGRLGGKDGDLIVKVKVSPKQGMHREGNDLIVRQSVDFAIASLGGNAKIELPTGELNIKIPAGTWRRRKLRIQGRGFPDPSTGRAGDLFVEILIGVPEDLDEVGQKLTEHYFQSVKSAADMPSGAFLLALEDRFGQSEESNNQDG